MDQRTLGASEEDIKNQDPTLQHSSGKGDRLLSARSTAHGKPPVRLSDNSKNVVFRGSSNPYLTRDR